jgi:pyridoxine kinase
MQLFLLSVRFEMTFQVLDPVLGDNGKLYVAESMVQLYSDSFLPIADIITPNQFEAEILSKCKISSVKEALEVARKLALKGPRVVIITSLAIVNSTSSQELTLLAYYSETDAGYLFKFPKFELNFAGTGDLFSALLVANLLNQPHPQEAIQSFNDLNRIISSVLVVVQRILVSTTDHFTQSCETNSVLSPKPYELRLIQNKKNIEHLLFISQDEINQAGISFQRID